MLSEDNFHIRAELDTDRASAVYICHAPLPARDRSHPDGRPLHPRAVAEDSRTPRLTLTVNPLYK